MRIQKTLNKEQKHISQCFNNSADASLKFEIVRPRGGLIEIPRYGIIKESSIVSSEVDKQCLFEKLKNVEFPILDLADRMNLEFDWLGSKKGWKLLH